MTDTISGGKIVSPNSDLVQQAKDGIWQDAMDSAKALSTHPEVIALYVIFAHTSALIAVDPSVTDAGKLEVITKGAYSFLRGLMSASGHDVSLWDDATVLSEYIKSLGG